MSNKKDAEEDKLTFASQLNYLLQNTTKPDGSPYTHREVASAIGVASGYISQLRNGLKLPGYEIMGKLADFFGVDVAYFYEEQPKDESAKQQQQAIDEIAFRAKELEEEDIKEVIKMLEYLGQRKREQGEQSDG